MRVVKHLIRSAIGPRRFAVAQAYKELFDRALADRAVLGAVLRQRFNLGYCTICEKPVVFVRMAEWLRDHYKCLSCGSIPRQRALVHVLETHFPNWRDRAIHESSPGGASSSKIKRECAGYTFSFFDPSVPLGTVKDGVRCENLERMTFHAGSFDLVITQDVFEHVLNPAPAFAEIARILKSGGAHIFTVPYYSWKATTIRAVASKEGIVLLHPPEYHHNPIDEHGSLVVTEWGKELVDVIRAESGLHTSIHSLPNTYLGIEGEFLEVFVSTKPEICREVQSEAAQGAGS
jgi:hypothetical protein